MSITTYLLNANRYFSNRMAFSILALLLIVALPFSKVSAQSNLLDDFAELLAEELGAVALKPELSRVCNCIIADGNASPLIEDINGVPTCVQYQCHKRLKKEGPDLCDTTGDAGEDGYWVKVAMPMKVCWPWDDKVATSVMDH